MYFVVKLSLTARSTKYARRAPGVRNEVLIILYQVLKFGFFRFILPVLTMDLKFRRYMTVVN